MNKYYVYMHIFPNNKKYIGITSQDINRRWREGKGYKKQQMLTRAINKYGWKNIEHINKTGNGYIWKYYEQELICKN